MSGWQVRDAADRDSAVLIELIAGCGAEYPGCVMDVDAEEPWLRAPATAYAEMRGHLWVVEQDGEVVACGGVRPAGNAVHELKSLYVRKSVRRRGIARMLADRIEEQARAEGAQRIELWSDTRFADAHQFYRTRGYIHTGQTRELHDQSNTVEYAFAKQLT